MCPQGTVGGWIPKPRNDRVDSVMMARPTTSVALTTMGPMALGSMWRNMMRQLEAPVARAASTNSFSLSDMNTPRTTRAMGIQNSTESTSTIAGLDPPEVLIFWP